MTGTGNDIVSLNAINSIRTKQPGFYSKILSASEQALYNKPDLALIPFETFVWLLWSIKESSFKCLQRNKPDLIFSPTKFIVEQLRIPFGYTVITFEATEMEGAGFESESMDAIKGTITVGAETLYSRSIIYKELIVSVVNRDDNFEDTYWGIKVLHKSNPRHQSKAVREFLVNRLRNLYHRNDLAIGKSFNGFPIVLEEDEEIENSISLSHHDHLVAYSFQSADFRKKVEFSVR